MNDHDEWRIEEELANPQPLSPSRQRRMGLTLPMTAPSPSRTVTADLAGTLGEFAEFRKVATTRISTFTMPPGTTYQTPEGLRAEDEDTRIAFDVQGGVYPIRESVFQQSYAAAIPVSPTDEEWSGETWRCPSCRDSVAPMGMCQKCGIFGLRYESALPVSPTDGLDAAWARAEAAIKAEGSRYRLYIRKVRSGYEAGMELPEFRAGKYIDSEYDTPAAALNALAARLEITRE